MLVNAKVDNYEHASHSNANSVYARLAAYRLCANLFVQMLIITLVNAVVQLLSWETRRFVFVKRKILVLVHRLHVITITVGVSGFIEGVFD